MLRRALLVVLVLLGAVACAPAAHAAGTPNVGLTADAPARVLLGKTATVSLTAANPSGQPYGYNLTFRDVLPAGISYVPGSASYEGAAVTPQVIGGGLGNPTTLIWSNVGDLSPNATGTLTYRVAHATAGADAYNISTRSSYTHTASTYLNTDPRVLPAFTAGGVYSSGATGQDAKSATTNITAVEITVDEPSPEGELLRGAHDHQTVYRLHLDNNTVAATGPLTVETYLPAGLEFLGCGQDDHTTDAPTNPGDTEEWPGSGGLDGNVAAPANCDVPSEVATVSLDPDGAGPLPTGVYTRVRWTGLAALAAGATRDIRYVAAVPMRENTMTWSGATPTAASLDQGSNLDNNRGARTQDEQALPTYATVGGNYNAVTPVSDDDTLVRTAEDVRILKSHNQGTITDGQLTRWTLAVDTGEYRYVEDIRVTDTVPDGLCPLSSPALSADGDCAFTAGNGPSAPYTNATENASGTWTLLWDSSTDAALARMQPSSHHEIAFSTRARTHYQENFNDDRPVLARDSWQNTVDLLGKDFQRCVAPADCDPVGAKIDTTPGLPAEPDADGTDDVDASAASQSAGSPSIDKTIRAAGGATPVDCGTGTYSDVTAGPYGPGDRVCFRLRVDFPSLLDTGDPTVTDFLPTGTTFESYVATPDNTVTIQPFTGVLGDPVVSWTLGDGSDDAANGQVFEVLVAARVVDPTAGASDQVKGNLMKFAHANTSGESFPLRDQVDFTWAEAQLSLTEGWRDVNDTPGAGNPANTDTGGVVQAGDTVTIRVDVTNNGTRDAQDAEVWERLPNAALTPASPTVDCAAVSNISDGGVCAAGRITWTGLDIAAAATRTLTYDYVVPAGVRPASTFNHRAGVRTYESDHNAGGTFRYYPATNIDPAVTAGMVNTSAAADPTSVASAAPTVTLTRSTGVNETGNTNATANAQATIGERIDYASTLTIPAGTTLSGSQSTWTMPIGPRQTFVGGTLVADLAGGPLPGGVTAVYDNSDPLNPFIRLTFPDGYVNASGSGADVFHVNFATTLDDEAANVAGGTLVQSGTFAYLDSLNAARTLTPSTAAANRTTAIVEPSITTTFTAPASGTTVSPGDVVAYTVAVANAAGRSRAHDTQTKVAVPAGLTPWVSGAPVADGGAVGGGTWDLATRTITIVDSVIEPGANASHPFTLRVDVPATAGSILTVSALSTTTSHPGATAGERTSASSTNTGYVSNASRAIELIGLGIAKTADRTTATVGEQATYSLDVTLRRDLTYYDVTVLDTLPANLTWDGFVDAACISGCGAPGDLGATPLPASGQTQGYFIGDVGQSGADRVVRIRYRAHVGGAAAEGDVLTNTATAYDNATNVIAGTPGANPSPGSFSQSAGPATHAVTVHEPDPEIVKDVTGTVAAGRITPGDTATYTVVVRNTGQSPLHDVHVTDRPDTELVAVTPVDGAALQTTPWAGSGSTMAWDIPGPIAPNAEVVLSYTAQLASSAGIAQNASVDNTARITSAYGLAAATRAANPGFTYPNYAPRESSANLLAVFPRVGIAQTTGAGGNPESAPAEVLQPFTWRVVVTNTGTLAVAHDLDVADVLPDDWTYVAGSAQLDGTPVGNPSISGQTLTWDDLVASLAPGASRVLTFQALPQTGARTNPNPHVAQASVDWEDESGATADGSGPYHAGPDPAEAVLSVPVLDVTKTPDGATADAGTDQSYTIVVENTGTVRARNVVVEDTLPSGVAYTPGTATPAGADTGFDETDGTGPSLAWEIDGLDAGETLTITLPVHVDASLDAGTDLENTAAATSDERPDPASDTGTITSDTHVDLALTKTAQPAAKAGEVVEWTLDAVNDGPSDGRDVVITDTLPAEVTFVSADDPGCVHAAGVVTCTIGTLAPGAHAVRRITTRIAPGTPDGGIVNTAVVGGSVAETDASNNAASATIAVGNAVDLELSKTTTTPQVAQTLNATWKLRVVNRGPSDAFGVTLVDTLPAGVTYVSATPDQGTCSVAGQVITCDLGRIDEQQDADVTVVATGDDVGTQLNQAEVSTVLNTEIDPTDNTASSPVDVTPVADLSVAKTGPAEVPAGGSATYTLTARNGGPSPATGVTLVDELPAGLTFASASAGCAASGQQVTCAVGALAVGATAERTVTVKVGTELGSATVQNRVRVSGTETDLDLSDNAATADTKVGPASDLRIAKRSTRLYATGEVTYILDVFNDGPSAAAGVTVRDAVPAGLSVVRVSSTQGTCATAGQDVRCDLGAMASGGAAAIQVVAAANGLAAGSTLENVARVSGDVLDPNPDNDVAKVSGVVDGASAPRYDLALTKTASIARPLVGEKFTYRLAVHNNGPDAAHNVTLTDPVPAGLQIGTITPQQGKCAVEGHLVRCALGTLKRGGRTEVTIVATATATGDFVNSALVAADGTDVDAENNGDVAGVDAVSERGGRITVKKTAKRHRVAGGGIVKYTIKVRARNTAASNVRVCDRLPDGMVFDRARGARFSAGRACWTIQLLRRGAVRTFRLTARAEVDARGRLVNRAIATAQGAQTARDRAAVRARPSQGTRGGGVTG